MTSNTDVRVAPLKNGRCTSFIQHQSECASCRMIFISFMMLNAILFKIRHIKSIFATPKINDIVPSIMAHDAIGITKIPTGIVSSVSVLKVSIENGMPLKYADDAIANAEIAYFLIRKSMISFFSNAEIFRLYVFNIFLLRKFSSGVPINMIPQTTLYDSKKLILNTTNGSIKT